MHYLQNLAAIGRNYNAIYCDVWGVLHNGVSPYDSAVRALCDYRQRGGFVILLTNSPRSSEKVTAQLNVIGVDKCAWDKVVTSGDSCHFALHSGIIGEKVFHIGTANEDHLLTPPVSTPTNGLQNINVRSTDFEKAEGIVCTGPFSDLTDKPEDYADLFKQAIARKMPLLCANPDIVVDRGTQRVYCAGALARLYTQMGGQSLYFGKPHKAIYRLANHNLNQWLQTQPSNQRQMAQTPKVLAIGDGTTTDIKGANKQNLDVLFVVGGLAGRQLLGDRAAETMVEKTKNYLSKQGLSATYIIDFLK